MAGVGDWKHIKKADCPHISELDEKTTSEKNACEVCGYNEDLRICLTRMPTPPAERGEPDGQACGSVFCCESHNSHNTEHFKSSDHPFVKPHKCDYNWLWCYKCNAFLDR